MEYRGTLAAGGKRFAIVAASFNSLITEKLVDGARHCILQHEGEEPDLFRVPGSMELAFIAKQLAETEKYQGIVCLGAIIKGETDHYAHIATATSASIAAVARESNVPVSFGVLTTHTVEEALNRAGIKNGNIGYSSALVVIEMSSLVEKINTLKPS